MASACGVAALIASQMTAIDAQKLDGAKLTPNAL
jgi:hypothetical protein